jgi:ketosteroid isomerase-like protein
MWVAQGSLQGCSCATEWRLIAAPLHRDTARVMAQADIDMLRSGYEAFNRRDIESLLTFFDPDATWIPSSSAWGAGRAYHGHEGVVRLFEDLERDWQEFESIPQEFKKVGDFILVVGDVRAIPRDGGGEIRSPTAWIWEMRGGKALRLQAYTDPRRALEALGIGE